MTAMKALEIKILQGLRIKGINCQSVFTIPDDESGAKVLIAFDSRKNLRLTIRKIEKTLNSLGIGQFNVSNKFHRLSAAFLHLEVALGTRTERQVMISAQ